MSTTSGAVAPRPTRTRYLIMVMLFVTVVINYLDRSNLSVASTGIAKDPHLTTFQQGLMLSAFGWTYAAAQIPGGWLVDRVPPRVLYPAALVLWSLATCLMGVVGSFVGLFVLRLAVGAFEAPAYPINNKVVTAWFPERERAGAIGFYTSGQFVGLALLTPLLLWMQKSYGWHTIFVVTGLVGLVWAVVWFAVYRGPRDFRGTNDAELEHIAVGGGLVDVDGGQHAKEPFRWGDLALVLSRRKLWGAYLGQFCLTSTLWFFLTWFPTYLVKYRHMDFLKTGFLASLPFVAAFVGVVFSGIFSDRLLRRGVSVGTARKLPIITGLLISISVLGANHTDSTGMVIFFLALAFFGNGLASITWSLVSALAPSRLLGLTGGVFNFIGNLSSIATPLIIGALVSETDFTPALVYIAVVSALGALSYLLLVGSVERIEG
ncbi:MFS transporter [Arsenicicoccus dermatophilus]|uniref:MFS transporter n=1 Tax=Arsenicicoccus dermatophilus TaxID=1076331 RepID=UPI001F4CFB7F|nr:MFS transporter [Arsenicicoccus dermatophilus]MCH8611551.1 MFS transporter [Arsenicicoccus dermatophilus]